MRKPVGSPRGGRDQTNKRVTVQVGETMGIHLRALVMVGGRNSIIHALIFQDDYPKIKTRRSTEGLVLYTYRKLRWIGKDKTMVVITGDTTMTISPDFDGPVKLGRFDQGISPLALSTKLQEIILPL
jgi:hypothetical protein